MCQYRVGRHGRPNVVERMTNGLEKTEYCSLEQRILESRTGKVKNISGKIILYVDTPNWILINFIPLYGQ